MREIVMVIADFYLPRGGQEAPAELAATFAQVPGIETAGRYGELDALEDGWRTWLALELGRSDLCGAAPACVAGAMYGEAGDCAGATWIATPVHLSASLTRVHLDHRGILRLSPTEQSTLVADFSTTFGCSGFSLVPLSSGDFLLRTPGIAPLATPEPARCAGSELAQFQPRGAAAAPLRRLAAEIEMWLHAHALNEARAARGELPVSALWPWGAAGRRVRPERRVLGGAPLAFGTDAWLEGLMSLQGSACRVLPGHISEVLLAEDAEEAVLMAAVGEQLQRAGEGTVAQALARLDERFVSPALRALERRELASVTLIINDTRATLARGSLLRLWRRRRAGLGAFA